MAIAADDHPAEGGGGGGALLASFQRTMISAVLKAEDGGVSQVRLPAAALQLPHVLHATFHAQI